MWICQVLSNKKGLSFSKRGPKDFWWRRGRVELPVQKSALQILYKLIRLFVDLLSAPCVPQSWGNIDVVARSPSI